MMNKFENLLDTRKKLDEVLKIANEQEAVLRKEIHDRKTAQYAKMWSDCMELREVAKQLKMNYVSLNTGIEVRRNITIWLGFAPTKGILLSVAQSGCTNPFHYAVFYEETILNEMRSNYSCAVDYMETVLANWDEAFNHMQDSLAEQAKKKMDSDVEKAKQAQEELIKEYNKYCK